MIATTPTGVMRRGTRLDPYTGPLISLAIAGALIAIALVAAGGLQLAPLTHVEIAVDIAAGLLCAFAAMVAAPARRPWGAVTMCLLGVYAILTGLSIIWAIDPSGAWVETNRTLTAVALFASGMALVRVAPDRWRALLGGVLIASVTISSYALLTKIDPRGLASDETYARLREPFQYWNAVGLTAALGIPPALWLGTRRDGHAALAALAFPALGVLFLTVLFSYSRGSLLAIVIGLALWLVLVPMRLRAVAVLLPSFVIAGLAALWAFAQEGLSTDNAELSLRADAGGEFAVLVATMIVLLLAGGLVICFARERRVWPAQTRQAWGIALLVGLAMVPLALAGALATSDRGLGGSVSHGWRSLTDPNANTPSNDPSRLTAIGSVRSRYWRDAISIFKARPAVGVGAGGYAIARLRFRKDDLAVLHAHGFVVQTAATLGILGLAVILALLAAWLASAARTTGPWGRYAVRDESAERIGALTLISVVVVFGVHSLIDWTWFIPGTVAPVMLCAGWIAARGPLHEPLAEPAVLRERVRAASLHPERTLAVIAILIFSGCAAWSSSRPQASVDKIDASYAALADGDRGAALRLVARARELNPLAVEPLFARATIDSAAGDNTAALRSLRHAIRLQPANAETWIQLALFDLRDGPGPKAALRDVRPALFLDRRSPQAQSIYLEAYRREQRAVAAKAAKVTAAAVKKRGASKGRKGGAKSNGGAAATGAAGGSGAAGASGVAGASGAAGTN